MAKVLMPLITQPNWITYGENLAGSPLRVDWLQPQKKTVLAMMRCQSNFAFKKNDVKAALEMIDSEKRNDPETAWNLPEKEKAEWITRSDLRFRTMARHMAQKKLEKPYWHT